MPIKLLKTLRLLSLILATWIWTLPIHAQEQEPVTLEVGYIPIMPMAQLYVIAGEGWDQEAGLNLEFTRFSSGPAIVQALASGNLDVVYFGIGPAMVSRAKGIDIQVVAANGIEQVALIAQGEFAEQMSKTAGAAGIRAFNQAQGRKVRIASLPKGSVPDTVLRYWLLKGLGVSLDEVEIIGMGEAQVQQALLTRSVDAASILEPILTIAQARLPSAQIIAWGGEMLPNQPGAIMAVRESTLAKHPEAIEKLVELHVRATELLNQEPERAVPHIEAFIGKGLIGRDLLEQALKSPATQFVADPHRIIEATQEMYDFQKEIGIIETEMDLDTLFNTRPYTTTLKQ